MSLRTMGYTITMDMLNTDYNKHLSKIWSNSREQTKGREGVACDEISLGSLEQCDAIKTFFGFVIALEEREQWAFRILQQGHAWRPRSFIFSILCKMSHFRPWYIKVNWRIKIFVASKKRKHFNAGPTGMATDTDTRIFGKFL